MLKKTNLRSFKQKLRWNKDRFIKFLKKLSKSKLLISTKNIKIADKIAWQKNNCLDCANCCKKMTPIYSESEIKKIALFLNTPIIELKNNFLQYNKKQQEWTNKTQPCPFLNLKNNYCSIYEVRPKDCASFPHFHKKDIRLYAHIHEQNMLYCPATLDFISTLEDLQNKTYIGSKT